MTWYINGSNSRILDVHVATVQRQKKVLHQLHCYLLPIIWTFNNSVDSLHKWMKGPDIEPTMWKIICWYIRVKGRKLCQDYPHLPMELSSASKSQDNIGWDNMMQSRICRHWNHWQSDYLKRVKYKKTGLNWAREFIKKLLQIGHRQWMYSNGVVHRRERMDYHNVNEWLK